MGQNLTYTARGAEMPLPPVRPGYTVEEWNTEQDGTGTEFTALTVVDDYMTVYAQWSDNEGTEVTVTFVANGELALVNGEATVIEEVRAGQSMLFNSSGDNLMPVATRPGYTFEEWNTAQDGTGTVFTEETAVPANMTVYAQWTANALVEVTFNANEGVLAHDGGLRQVRAGQTLAANTTGVEMPDNPTRAGHSFAGWNTEPDGSGDSFTADTVIDEDIDVYAQWEVVPVVITFNPNGGTLAAGGATRTVKHGQSLNSNTNGASMPGSPSRGGFNFQGWNTSSAGTGAMFDGSTIVTANITVYARWTAIGGGGGTGPGDGGGRPPGPPGGGGTTGPGPGGGGGGPIGPGPGGGGGGIDTSTPPTGGDGGDFIFELPDTPAAPPPGDPGEFLFEDPDVPRGPPLPQTGVSTMWILLMMIGIILFGTGLVIFVHTEKTKLRKARHLKR
jgi:uncharacterized repeat protein (TIGR02543 family)/LPXTG-motif cell wall-anchored protein